MLSIYCAMRSLYYANLAGINFGIVTCCFMMSIVMNVTFGYIFFNEKMNFKMIIGIFITMIGIAWISLAKSASSQSLA